MVEHRWSGWPGAWCLDCGVEDEREVCLADDCEELNIETGECSIHINKPCEQVGMRRADPYFREALKRIASLAADYIEDMEEDRDTMFTFDNLVSELRQVGLLTNGDVRLSQPWERRHQVLTK